MVEFIETGNRVFRFECVPDTPGYMKRTITVTQESGRPATNREWRKILRLTMRKAKRLGLDNIRGELF